MKPSKIKGIAFYAGILIVLVLVMTLFLGNNSEKKYKYSQIVKFFENEQVRYFEIKDNELQLQFVDSEDGTAGEKIKFKLYSPMLFISTIEPYVESAMEKEIMDGYDLTPADETPLWLSFIPYIIFGVVIILFWLYMVGQVNGANGKAMSFGKARLKASDPNQKKVMFSDVAGADEEKEELTEIVEFLKNPSKYTEMGAHIPKGILLVGHPGTGKTYLAKATSGEAGVPFFSISGSDFVELYVGVGASRVRDVFDQAKKSAPCIVFIDEIDAVGRQRGAGLGGGHDEREQTLNQLLVEMDGFEDNEGVIVMAATNRPDILDSALLRPGRFDRQIVINLPDVDAREAILKIHAKNKPIAADVDLSVIAKTTAGFSPADLQNILNEAALLAARRSHKAINMSDVEDAILKVVVGIEKKTHKISDKEKKLTAYHEGGHAIINSVLPSQGPVHQISIIPRGMAGGYTLSLPTEDKSYQSKNEMFEEIVSLLGGRVAEALCLDDISTGASNDIERATGIAKKMVTKYGMSDVIGPISFGDHDEVFLGRDFASQRSYSEEFASLIDKEVKTIIDKAYSNASQILSENRNKLERIASVLMEKEKMSADEFLQIFNGDSAVEQFV